MTVAWTRLLPACRRSALPRVAALVIVAALPGACARHPHVEAPVDQALTPREFAAARLDDPAWRDDWQRLDPDAAGSPARWTPARIGLLAALRSRAVREAQAALTVARAARAVAVQRQNPLVSLGLERHSLIDDNQSGHWSIGPSVELTLAPRGRRALIAARADVEITRARLAIVAAAWTARDAAVGAALALLAQRELAAREAGALAARDAALAAARASVAAGVADPFEWQTMVLAANEARLARLARITETAQAQATLAAALALPVTALQDLAFAPPPAGGPAPAYDDLQLHMLTHDPAVLAALADFDAAERDLALAVHAQYPSVQLNPGYFFDQGDHVWSLLGGVVVPVLANHDAAITRAEAAREAARAHVHAVQAARIAALSEAYARWQTSLDVRREAQAIAADVRRHHEELAARAATGVVDRLAERRAAQQVAELDVQLAMSAAAVRAARHALESTARLPRDDPPFARYLDELQAADATQPEP